MADNNESIQALETFINSSAFNIMPPKMQDELRQNLANLLAQKNSELIQSIKKAILETIELKLGNSPLEFTFVVERKNNVITISEDTQHTNTEITKTEDEENNEIQEGRTQSKTIGFTVQFPDGKKIKKNNAKMTFVHTLVEIGLDKIVNCGFNQKFAGYDLIGKDERTENPGNWQYKFEDWYIYTYMDNARKVATLMQIDDLLGLGLRIFFDDGTEYQYIPTPNHEPSKHFKVVFPDGIIICEEQAVHTFTRSIEKIGLERVASMNNIRTHGGYPLVGKKQKIDYGKKWQEEVEGWYVFTYFNNQRKALVLHELDSILGLGLKLYIGNEEVKFDELSNNPDSVDITKQDGRSELRTTNHDTSKYSLNGGAPVGKSRLALQIVKEYIKQYPEVDYEHLKEVFVPSITSSTLGVVRSLMDMPDSMPEDEYPRRYFFKDEELITLHDQDIIAVCSQWNPKRIAKMIDIAIDEGWSVVKVGDEPSIEPSYEDLEVEQFIYNPKTNTVTPMIPESQVTENRNDNTEFGVTFADGSYIEEETPFITFIATLQKIGLSRIPDVGVTYGNINLVSDMQKDANKQIFIDGLYIYKDLTSTQMMDALQQISDYYYMDLEIGTEEE